MSKAIGFLAVITWTMITLTAGRPQETATEDVEDVLQQDTLSSVDEEQPLALLIDADLQQSEPTAGYEDQETEATTVNDVLEPSTESSDSPTEISSRESQELLKFDANLDPTLPTQEASPFYPEEVSPLPPPYVEVPSFTTPEKSQLLSPTLGASPLFPFAGPALARNQTLTTGNQSSNPSSLIGSLWQQLNHSQRGNATAGGAGSGSVQNNSAIADGKGIANVGFGGFGIGLGIGGAIQTPLGNLAFGQGNGIAIG